MVSDNAFKRIATIANRDNKKALLRVAVKGGGCSGFIYEYMMIPNPETEDLIISNNIAAVAIDPTSQNFLTDCKLDFIEELGNSYFTITNPQAAAKCGCGNSFAI